MSKEAIRAVVWEKTDGHCAYCGLALTPDSVGTMTGRYQSWMQVDHVMPRARGGSQLIENLMPSCQSCNATKRHKTLEEYRHYVSLRKAGWPRLTEDVVEWLNAHGFQFPAIPVHKFWFEAVAEREAA